MIATSEWQGQFHECLSEGVEAQRRAQYVAYQNPNPTSRQQFPYLLDIQSNLLGREFCDLYHYRSEIIAAVDFVLSGI